MRSLSLRLRGWPCLAFTLSLSLVILWIYLSRQPQTPRRLDESDPTEEVVYDIMEVADLSLHMGPGLRYHSMADSSTVVVDFQPLGITPAPPPDEPRCPEGFRPDADMPLLDSLRHCSHDGSFAPELELWLYTEVSQCCHRFVTYNHQVALLRGVIMDTSYCRGRSGGEDLEQVLNLTSQEQEYYSYEPGFFQLSCASRPTTYMSGASHLQTWLDSLTVFNSSQTVNAIHTNFTIAVIRYEYHNIYHTMSDIYNTFLAMTFFGVTPDQTNILIIDGHPRGLSAVIWETLFHEVFKIGYMPVRNLFHNLFWNQIGYNSYFLDYEMKNLPYIEQFRKFLLSKFKATRKHRRNCEKLKIVLISRKDYIRSNQNLDGRIERKLRNEKQILNELKHYYRKHFVNMVHLEDLDFTKQLKLIVQTDVLIGLHGAGLTHALFLPQTSGVIEIIPSYWRRADGHFQAICRWRHLVYTRWRGENSSLEDESKQELTMPTKTLLDLTNLTINKMCYKDMVLQEMIEP